MRKAVMIVLALLVIRLLPRSVRAEARALGLLSALIAGMTAMAAANTSKAVSTENRTASLETRVGNLESQVTALNQGQFTAISGGRSVTLVSSSNESINASILARFGSVANAQFLNTLTQCGPQAFAGGDDNNTGPSWASGERGYINDAKHSIDAIHSSLINHGFMAS